MKYFLDTEFFDNGLRVIPISVGIVAEDGREFYAECYEGSSVAFENEWLKKNVAIHLDRENSFLIPVIRKNILAFVGEEPAEFWAYWAAYDWVVFCQLMGGLMKLPRNVCPWIKDFAWLLDEKHMKADQLGVINSKPHHALFDARELRDQYRTLVNL